MGFSEGRIVINQTNGNYYPGQTIVGKVVFEESKAKTFRGIYLVIKGSCEVRWREYRRNGFDDVYESYEEYIHLKMYLMGDENGKVTLVPGRYELPFQFVLPDDLPSSFVGTVGSITYGLKAVLDRAYKFNEHLTCPLVILPHIDLNMIPAAKNPLEFHIEDVYCTWCVMSGTAEVLVKLPTTGLCVGQTIPVEVTCANKSPVKIKKIRLAIKSNTKYIATSLEDEKFKSEKLLELSKGPVPAHSSKNWVFAMKLPDMTLYNLNICQFINRNYIFKVTVETSGCHINYEEMQNIFIGNVPLRDVGVSNHPTGPHESSSALSHPGGSQMSGSKPTYP